MKNRHDVPTVKGLLCNSQLRFLSTHLLCEFHFLLQSAAGNVPDTGLSIRGSSYQNIKQNVMDKILLLEWNTKGMSPVPRIIELWHGEGREESNDPGIYFMLIIYQCREGHTVQLSHLITGGHCNARPCAPSRRKGSLPLRVCSWLKPSAEERGFAQSPSGTAHTQ